MHLLPPVHVKAERQGRGRERGGEREGGRVRETHTGEAGRERDKEGEREIHLL
jgi:hypothetical protein